MPSISAATAARPARADSSSEWEDYRDDLGAFLALVRRDEPDLPLFLIGNSLGGLIALDYAMHAPAGLRGLVTVSAPLGRLAVPAPLLALGRVLSRVWPRFSAGDRDGSLRPRPRSGRHRADPRRPALSPPRHGPAFDRGHRAIARVQAGAPAFTLPVLVLHGSDDRMVPPAGSRAFAGARGIARQAADRVSRRLPRAVRRYRKGAGAGGRRGLDRGQASARSRARGVQGSSVKSWW